MTPTEEFQIRWDWCKEEAEKLLMEIMHDNATMKQYKHAKSELQSALSEAWGKGCFESARRNREFDKEGRERTL
jgi:hypothetical protein